MRHTFKRLLAGASLAALASTLGACAGGGITASQLQNDVSSIEAQVQADSNLVCGFVPTAATIVAFIPGAGSIAADAASIASGICSAIAKAPVVKPTASAHMRSVALGVNVHVTDVATPNGVVSIDGKFTR